MPIVRSRRWFLQELSENSSREYAAISENPDEPFSLFYVGPLAQSDAPYEQMLAETEPFSAVSLLMGCSSLRMGTRGNWTHIGAPLYYALNRCPVVVGCLWDVSDGDLDRMTKFMLNSVMVGKERRM